ncbi:MAG: DUF3341 domain-containing protein [Acidobacteria bacterium]|nr:DUF3341 domain-containing protein [Acidobacteriota bacterium]
MSGTVVIGVYADARAAARAAEAIRQAELGAVETLSPTADHALLAAVPRPASPVRPCTLLGALAGCAAGIALPVYTMLAWPLIVGGKPPVPIPPIVVIAFELSMLGAALGGLAGFLVSSGLAGWRRRGGLEGGDRFTDDRFGVLVTCAETERAAVRAHLVRSGAEEIAGDA